MPDSNLHLLAQVSQSEKIVPLKMHFMDVPGLVEGASQGKGMGNQFLGDIRGVSVILHVVRCFEDSDIIHVEGDVNPIRDMQVINDELILADLELVERRLKGLKKKKGGPLN